MKQSVFYLAKMDCPTEEGLIRKNLEPMPGVKALKFNLMEHRLTVEHTLNSDQPLFAALQKLGMQPKPGDGAESAPAESRPKWFWLLLACSGALAATAEVLAYRGAAENSPLIIGLAVAAILLSGRDTFAKGWIALRSFTLNINFLMCVAVAGAVAIGEWPEAAMVTFLFAVAETVESYSLDRARNAIRALMELSPENATRLDAQGNETQVPAEQVSLGELLRVKPGERIALDGEIVSGSSSVNQAPITGESLPVEKRPGDPVFAGTINERGTFDFKVTAARGETTLDRIVAAVQEAQGDRAPTQRFVDRFASYYTPVMLLLAILIALVPPLFFNAPWLAWVYRALTLLVVACPCALVISTPVTVVSGLAAGARAGILIKGGVYLENGRRLRAVALDKTGTLTEGRPKVTDILPLAGLSAERLLQITASLESRSEHPVASAIMAYWDDKKADQPLLPVEDFEALVGRGLRGVVDGQPYRVGSFRLLQEAHLATPPLTEQVETLEGQGKTVVFLLDQGSVLGLIAVADQVRESSVEAVRQLRELGIEPMMLTGDNQKTAQAIAGLLGIETVSGNLLPEDKLRIIEQALTKYEYVGMVGDGINDAPALARSSIGFAMGAAGTATALETADVALMQDDLRRLPEFVRLSQHTARILTQNITFSLGVKLVSFALTLTGHVTLWMAIFADLGASLIVIANGLRLLRYQVRSRPTAPRKP
jgi:Zn2+/Cd2+-exporting ATPase